MKKNRTAPSRLSLEQIDLSVAFYDDAVDHPRENFELIAKRVVPRGFGKSKTSAAFKKESRKMYDLAR